MRCCCHPHPITWYPTPFLTVTSLAMLKISQEVNTLVSLSTKPLSKRWNYCEWRLAVIDILTEKGYWLIVSGKSECPEETGEVKTRWEQKSVEPAVFWAVSWIVHIVRGMPRIVTPRTCSLIWKNSMRKRTNLKREFGSCTRSCLR